MDSTITDREKHIKEIVCEILELETEEVTDTSDFSADHGADSLRALEILAALEREFNLLIDQAELSRMRNLRGVYEVVAELSDR